MEPHPKPRAALEREGRVLLVSMVVIGYVVTFVIRSGEQGGGRFTFQELLLGFSFGVVYLFLALNDQVIFDRLPTGWAEALFFSVQCALVLGIGWVLGPGGNWAIGVPLAGFAVERLTPRRRWPVYAALIATVVLPIGLRQATWTGALLTMLINAVISGSAVFFVAAFAQMRLNEQQARQKAERLTAELEKANVQLAAYATQAEELAITQERNRLAREIHDSLGHYLTTVNVQIEAAKVVMNSDADRALDAMNKAQEMTQKGLTRVRESVAALRESPVSNRPLREAVASLVQEAQSTGIVTEFQVVGEPQTLENKVALALYRAAQEGLTNVRKHAHASRVDVLLEFQPDEVSLEIRDNGVGAEEPSGGFGLLGTRERMQLLGGRLEISTGVGKGFRLTASVPMVQTHRPAEP